jgi:hypothetical protein
MRNNSVRQYDVFVIQALLSEVNTVFTAQNLGFCIRIQVGRLERHCPSRLRRGSAGHRLAGIAGSNPTGSVDVCFL